ncbi:MAG: lipid-A-disaccharide synthase N-terminal domain-containing protein [Planctomycetota bacterium]|jgi:lipid-A-disaccharide synthase-like uncharacterized protein
MPVIVLVAAAAPDASVTWLDPLLRWANVTSGWEIALVGFGIVAQVMFFLRWIVQWIASERRGVSHVPLLFWWLSLAGASMLLVYFFLRGEPVGLLGQSVGWIVYSRNLYLIRRQRRAAEVAQSACPGCGALPGADSDAAGRTCPDCGYDWPP